MIVFGYPGIGKTTIAKYDYRFIDLDPSDPLIRWRWPWKKDDWVTDYCNMALLLSKQGYYVMVSTHPKVIRKLVANGEESYCFVYPDISIRKEWVNKLKERYKDYPNRSTHNAYVRARDHFEEDFYQMERLHGKKLVIKSMEYELKKCIVAIFEGTRGG